MKFVSFKKNGTESWGAFNSETGKILELISEAPNLLSFIQGPWEKQIPALSQRLSQASIDSSDVEFMACLPHPQTLRDAYAFRQHVEAARRNRGVEMIPEYDQIPVFYLSNHRSVAGPGPVKVRAPHLEKLDFELEVAIVVGKDCRDLKVENADQYIFGYTIFNDWSARALQMQEMKLNMGPCKGKDFANSLGPWLVTRDELEPYLVKSEQGERYDLEMHAIINGVETSKGNMKDMSWTFAQILERASWACDLKAGDVIGSGTVGTGCYLELNGSGITNRWIEEGDEVILRVDALGELKNTIVLDD